MYCTVDFHVAWRMVPPSAHSKLNDTLGVKSPFFCFLVGGAITEAFGSSYLSGFFYICELAFSSLHNVCKRCGSLLSLLLPAPPGSLLPCFYQSPCHHWDGGLYPCILDPLRHGLGCAGRGTVVGKPGSYRHLYHVEFCKVHRLQHCEWARGQGHVHSFPCCCWVLWHHLSFYFFLLSNFYNNHVLL